MSELETMIEQAGQEVMAHTQSVLQEKAAVLFSPEAQRVLELRYAPEHNALVIGCLPVPCWLHSLDDGSGNWIFGCPWSRTVLNEDEWFEERVLMEVGKVKLHLDGMLEKIDPMKVN